MLRRILPIFIVVAAVLVAFTGSAAAAIRFVAPAGSDEGGNDCLSSADPCQTVQWGIQRAEAGDIVSLAAGTYVGEFQLNKELTLTGQGPSTLLEGEPTIQRPVFIRSNATLENLRIRGGLNGSEAKDAIFIGGTEIQVSLDHVIAEQAPTAIEGRNAVYVSPGNSLTMTDSTITGVGTTCLWVSGSATLTGSIISMTPGLRGGAALHVTEGGTADLADTIVTDSGEKIPNQGERGNALTAEGGTVSATDSTFLGPRSIVVSKATILMSRDKITAHEAGLVLHGGANTELRDSLIAPPPGGWIGADVLIETEVAGVPPTLTIIGSTLYANGPSRYRAARAILAYSPIHARIANTILQAFELGSINAAEIEADGGTWSMTHSVFTTVYGSGAPAPGSGTNVAMVPTFANQAAGDYRLTGADQALLGAGDPAQLGPGETDLAGQPRVLAGVCSGNPDIGAYELVRTERCPQVPIGSQGQTSQKTEQTSDGESAKPFSPSAPRINHMRVQVRPRGPILKFAMNEPAKVTVNVARAITHGSGKRRKKTSYRTIAKISQAVGQGPQTLSLSTRLGRRKLTPGTYRLILVANADGLRSATNSTAYFEVSGR